MLSTSACAQQTPQTPPCMGNENHRAFDFWIGTWEVKNAQDRVAGTNRITREEQGCMLLERWTGASGSTGSSINYYDRRKGQWVQNWVSADGTIIEIAGNLQDGAMVLVGEISYANGGKFPFRGTWTPLEDGRVRQFFEQSNDEGQTWTAWFDGYYARMDEE